MFFSFSMIKVLCGVDFVSLAQMFDSSVSGEQHDVYEASLSYLKDVARYCHSVVITARYYLGKINIAQSYSVWKCPMPLCIFTTGGTGESKNPHQGATFFSSFYHILMNSALLAFFSVMNLYHFLKGLEQGNLLFLLPFAVFFRSIPALRRVGAVMFGIVIAFFFAMPVTLALLSVAFPVPAYSPPDESSLHVSGSFGAWFSGSASVSKLEWADVQNSIALFANFSFYGIIIPNVVLLATFGAAFYMGGMFGEDIDASHVFRIV
jgi:hypothetical protein